MNTCTRIGVLIAALLVTLGLAAPAAADPPPPGWEHPGVVEAVNPIEPSGAWVNPQFVDQINVITDVTISCPDKPDYWYGEVVLYTNELNTPDPRYTHWTIANMSASYQPIGTEIVWVSDAAQLGDTIDETFYVRFTGGGLRKTVLPVKVKITWDKECPPPTTPPPPTSTTLPPTTTTVVDTTTTTRPPTTTTTTTPDTTTTTTTECLAVRNPGDTTPIGECANRDTTTSAPPTTDRPGTPPGDLPDTGPNNTAAIIVIALALIAAGIRVVTWARQDA